MRFVTLDDRQRGEEIQPLSDGRLPRDSARPVQPCHISPWQDEKPSKMPAPVLVTLRGDFFCLPFGGNSETVSGEKHPPHGEIVGDAWKVVGTKKAGDVTTLTTAIDTKVRKGRVTKELSLVEGRNVVCSRHTIEGFAGRVPLGHHATLAMPEKEGAVRIATSAFRFGMTCPSLFSDPKQREYQALLPGAIWTDLAKVPAAWKGAPDADLTRLPGRYGYADLIQLVNEAWEKTGGPAWTTATFAEAGCLWFALKDSAVLNSTVFWMDNHGRHGHPWNGRNNCLGLEDVTAKDTGYKAAEDVLQAHSDLRGIFAINGPAARGARAVLEKAGKAQVLIIGFDGQPEGKQAIKDGKIYADPIQFPDKMGVQIGDAMIRHSKGETLPPQMLISTSLYRKADAMKDPELK